MRVILDTNVLVSGVFFGGVPGRILMAWREGAITLVLSAAIFDEYQRVGRILASQHPGVALDPFLVLLAVHAELVETEELPERISADPDDDKFLACAVAAKVHVIVSGDKHLVACSGWRGVRVLRPRELVDELLDLP